MPRRNDHALSEHAARLLDAIVPAVRAAADPASAVRRAPLPDGFEPTALLATGKASAPMVEAALARPDHRFEVGAITCVPAHEQRLRAACAGRPGLTIHPADHPLATARNIEAARAVAETATTIAAERREALILISGGASAHLVSPAPGLSLEDLRATTDALLRAGATIGQLNTVRKHCEALKGGRLARLLAPARAHVLVLSDVLGDPLDTIGSGPTAPDPTTLAEAIAVLESFSEAPVPNTVAEHLHRSVSETPKPGDACFETVSHEVIANNTAARRAAEAGLRSLGIPIDRSLGGVEGEASAVAGALVRTLVEHEAPAGVIFAGESTVTVGDAPGIGGRNQELALAAAVALEAIPGAAVLTLATDGIDGPTDAAGAIVTSETAPSLRRLGIEPSEALSAHDSHTALDAVGALIRTGPTGSNINDIAVAVRF